jgi:hypothetical protein
LPAFFAVALRLFPGALRCVGSVGLRQFHACASSFRESDRDCLFRVRRAMLSFANVVHLFADKLAGLSARRFAFFFVLFGSFNDFLLRHNLLLD